MNKIFRMDLHRLLHSRVFYVSIAFLIAMAVGQVMGGMSTTFDGLMGVATTGNPEEDFMSSAMGAGVIYILLSIIIALFVCGDYSGGYAKNIFAVHSNPKDYIGGKMMSMAMASGFLLVLYTIVSMLTLAISGYAVTLTGGILGLIFFLIEKWLVSCALAAVVLLVAFFTRNIAWSLTAGFLIATGGLTMGVALFAEAFNLGWIEDVFSVTVSGAAKICTMTFDPIIFLRVLLTSAVWGGAACFLGRKVLLTKDI